MRASARPFFHFGFSFVLFRLVLVMCVLFPFFRSSSSSSFSNLPTINHTILHTHTRSHASHFLDNIACRHVVYFIWRDQVASCIFLVLFCYFYCCWWWRRRQWWFKHEYYYRCKWTEWHQHNVQFIKQKLNEMWFSLPACVSACNWMAKSERESHQWIYGGRAYRMKAETWNLKHAIWKVQCARVHILIVVEWSTFICIYVY